MGESWKMDFVLNPLCRKFDVFSPSTLDNFLRFFCHIREAFAVIVPDPKFCLVGGALFGALALHQTPGGKVPGSISAAAPVQHILLDIEDDEHEQDHKHDEDDADENDDEDEFEDDKG